MHRAYPEEVLPGLYEILILNDTLGGPDEQH